MAVSSGFRVQGSGFDVSDAEHDSFPHASAAGGHHLLVDFWVSDAEPLRRVATWEDRLPQACRAAGATVLGSRFHQFEPDGVTGVVLLAESHASVHTWPQAGLVTLDVFTCGALDTAAIVDAVRQWLAPARERVTAVARGDVAQPSESVSRPPYGHDSSCPPLPCTTAGHDGACPYSPPRLGTEADTPGGTEPGARA